MVSKPMLLITDIFKNSIDISFSYRTNIVSFAPEAGTPDRLNQFGKEFPQFIARSAFHQLHNLSRRVRRAGSKYQVYVIRLYSQLLDVKSVYLRTKTNHSVKSLFYLARQLPSSIFGYKRKVIRNIVGSMTSKFYHFLSLSYDLVVRFCAYRITFLSVLKGRSFL